MMYSHLALYMAIGFLGALLAEPDPWTLRTYLAASLVALTIAKAKVSKGVD